MEVERKRQSYEEPEFPHSQREMKNEKACREKHFTEEKINNWKGYIGEGIIISTLESDTHDYKSRLFNLPY